jgi:hypothetical protein
MYWLIKISLQEPWVLEVVDSNPAIPTFIGSFNIKKSLNI